MYPRTKSKLRVKGDELRRRRLELFLEQEELGKRAGLSASAISRLEQEAGFTRPATVTRLAEALGCQPEDIAELVAVPEEASA